MDSGLLLRTNLANGRAACGVYMPRFKLALGLVLLAGILVAVAIAMLKPFWAARPVNEPERAAFDRGRTGERAVSREKKSTAEATGADSIIRDLVESPGQMNSIETNAAQDAAEAHQDALRWIGSTGRAIWRARCLFWNGPFCLFAAVL